MRYNDILRKLYRLEGKGTNFGLERVENMLKEVGNPHKKLKSIHVAGTNGKGSVCAMLRSILMEAGFKVGMYISPHLVHFSERITIDAIGIPEKDFITHYMKLEPIANKEKATFFEIVTVIAMMYFADKKVDYAVFEVGLGGRLDATNVVQPIVTAITNIGLEHQDMLGTTISEIAKEKAGIIKKNIPVVTMAQGEALRVIKSVASKNKAKVLIPTKEYNSGLEGDFQKWNAAVAVTAFKQLKIRTSDEMIRRGLSRVNWPGRIQRMDNIILDCAHNPDAAQALSNHMSTQKFDRLFLVFGALSDKDVKSMLKYLNKQATMTILTKPSYRRAAPLEKMSAGLKSYLVQEKVDDAVRFAKNIATEKDIVLVTGSCYVVGEALSFLTKKETASPKKTVQPRKENRRNKPQRRNYRRKRT